MEINESEFKILRGWYDEWIRASRLLATFSFAAVGFTILVFDLKSGRQLDPKQTELIRQSWFLFGGSGLLSGLSIMLAYVWMDTISRIHAPSLIGKVLWRPPWRPFLRLGVIGWAVTVVSVIMVLIGATCTVQAALLLLK